MTTHRSHHSSSSPRRGTALNPPNRFERLHTEPFADDDDSSSPAPEDSQRIKTQFYTDNSKTIIASNDSPDIPFEYSINPYRGCEHGCIYCYARPYHEFLGFSLGVDFESKIVVKTNAEKLLRAELNSRAWKPKPVTLSGVTDPYQPPERSLKITQKILQVCADFRQPVNIITKNSLILRDLDILKELAHYNCIRVNISIPTIDPSLARILEPRTSTPQKRLAAIRTLTENGIPSGILLSPVIPGLTDENIPSVLKSAAEHGAQWAFHTILRLPFQVRILFLEWLKINMPERFSKIENRIRSIHEGELDSSQFGKRMAGSGEYSGTIHRLVELMKKKYQLDGPAAELSTEHFRRVSGAQLGLF